MRGFVEKNVVDLYMIKRLPEKAARKSAPIGYKTQELARAAMEREMKWRADFPLLYHMKISNPKAYRGLFPSKKLELPFGLVQRLRKQKDQLRLERQRKRDDRALASRRRAMQNRTDGELTRLLNEYNLNKTARNHEGDAQNLRDGMALMTGLRRLQSQRSARSS